MGVLVSIAYGVVPLGYLLAGVLVERIGAGATLAAAAGAGVVVVADHAQP